MATIAPLPNIAQIQGGLNAVNQAAFANPQQPTSPLSILPTVPTGVPNFPATPSSPSTPAGRGTAGGGGGTGPLLGGGDQARGGNFLNTIRQRLGLPGAISNVSRGTAFQPRGAQQGGPGVGMAAANDAIGRMLGSNQAVHPSLTGALKMGEMFMGPSGLALGLGNLALGDPMGKVLGAILGDNYGATGFNVPGGYLSPDAQQAIRDSFYGALNPTASNIQQAIAAAQATLTTERALAGMQAGGMPNMGTVQGAGAMATAPGSSGYGGVGPMGVGGGDSGVRGSNPSGMGGGVGGGFGGGPGGGQNRSM